MFMLVSLRNRATLITADRSTERTTAATMTSTRMLRDLKDPREQEAWRSFDARYRPLIAGVARRMGLGVEEAADVAQETLVTFMELHRSGRYERGRGRLRHWLMGIARNMMFAARRGRRPALDVHSLDVADQSDNAALWSRERSALLIRRAIDELRAESRLSERSLAAFERLVIAGQPASDVAAALGMTRQEVYLAKHRVAERLRETVARLDAEMDDEPGAR